MSADPLPPEIAALLNAYEESAKEHGAGKARGLTMTLARTALETAITALVRDGETARRERDEWRALAMKSGHYVTAQLEKHTEVLTGSLKITTEIIALSKCDAIDHACAKLAREFRATYRAGRPRAASTPTPTG